jgi:hypothetical protein
MPIMIWIAIIIMLALSHWIDFGILLAIQFINAFLGWCASPCRARPRPCAPAPARREHVCGALQTCVARARAGAGRAGAPGAPGQCARGAPPAGPSDARAARLPLTAPRPAPRPPQV